MSRMYIYGAVPALPTQCGGGGRASSCADNKPTEEESLSSTVLAVSVKVVNPTGEYYSLSDELNLSVNMNMEIYGFNS